MYAIENVGHILEKVRLDQTLEGGEGVSGRESRERVLRISRMPLFLSPTGEGRG